MHHGLDKPFDAILQPSNTTAETRLSLVAFAQRDSFQVTLTAAGPSRTTRRAGLVHPNAATEDPDTQPIGIYDIDPLGPIDRYNTQDTIRRALARRCTLELSWFCVASNAQLDR